MTGAVCLAGALCMAGGAASTAHAGSNWDFPLSSGYDIYVHDYFLAESDTTEVIQEFNFTAAANGSSEFSARNRWFMRAGLSGGTELYRQSLDTGFRLRNKERHEWLRGDLLMLARQFREGSEYSLSSNNHEGRMTGALSPWTTDNMAVELRARGRYVNYERPSTLEVDYVDGSAGAYLRSPSRSFRTWRVGGLYTARDYPDSGAIDREGFILEGDYDHGRLEGVLRAYHRSERRNIADPDARPSAWFHWTELDTAHPTSRAEVVLRASSEVWDYDEASGAWYDSWQLGGQAGARWGDPLNTRVETLITAEHLEAGDEPETYWQTGLRVGAETLKPELSGSISIEVGRRWYRNSTDDPDSFALEYTDYSYLAFWLMGNWMINEHFSVDVTANFEPESHTEQDDNITLGYGSLRLVWRP